MDTSQQLLLHAYLNGDINTKVDGKRGKGKQQDTSDLIGGKMEVGEVNKEVGRWVK